MKNSPFFTVIIPTRNRSKLLKQSIESVLNQTFQDFEIIIIDDHSTDNTKEVIFSFKNDKIRYFLNNRPKGGGGARNVGIFHARGKWVAFLDDDDIWLPKKLEIQYKKIKKSDKNVGLIYGGLAIYDLDKKIVISKKIPEKKGWLFNDLLYKNHIGTLCSVVIKRDLLVKVGGFDENFPSRQDIELYVRISKLAKISFVKDILIYYILSNKDRISRNHKKRLQGYVLFFDKYKRFIIMNNKTHHMIKSYIFIYAYSTRDWKYVLKAMPWTLYGCIFDIKNFLKVLLKIIKITFFGRKYKDI